MHSGTYSGGFTINKSVALIGSQSDTLPEGTERTDGESVISGGYFGITVEADDVTISGFEISGFSRDGINVRTLENAKPDDSSIGAYREGVTISNNWIHSDVESGQQNGVLIGEFEGDPARSDTQAEISNMRIVDNYIDIDSESGYATSLKFTNHFDMQFITNILIQNNTVIGSDAAFFHGADTSTFRFDGARIIGNTFDGRVNSYNLFDATIYENEFSGVALLGIDGSTVSNNTFNSSGDYGLGLWGDEWGANYSRDSSIANNVFKYNISANGQEADAGIAILSGAEASTIAIDGNQFVEGSAIDDLPVSNIVWLGTGGDDTLDAAVLKDLQGNSVDLSVNLTLLDLATNTEDFEDFVAGPITDGENGWTVAGNKDQEVIVDPDDIFNHVFRMSSDPSSEDFGGPYGPNLAVTAGESTTTAGADGMQLTFTVKAVQPGDNSRLEVDFGNEEHSDRVNFMVIENTSSGIRIATSEPQTNGNWTSDKTPNDFTAFTGNRTIVDGLENNVEHEITLILKYVDGSNNDVIDIYVDGVLEGKSTTFENYHQYHLDGAHDAAQHSAAQETHQASTIFFRGGSGGADTDGPGGKNQGFLFDDITYSSFNAADANATGNELDNVIVGNSADNIITGLGGDDTLTGNIGSDVFVFSSGSGNDIITDFTRGADKIDISAFGISFAILEDNDDNDDVITVEDDAASYENGALTLDFGGGTITLVGISQLSADDFDFGA